jgi:DNA-binding beta-propeller fold protein YncE
MRAGNGQFAFSGDGGPATAAGMRDPAGVSVDGSGNLVIADNFDNRIRVVAATSGTFYGVAMTAGDIYTVAATGTAGFAGDSGPAIHGRLDYPAATAVDAAGNLLVVDEHNGRVRQVTGTAPSRRNT